VRSGKVSKLPRAEQWADRICTQLGKSVESIIEVGRLLVKAKADLEHGEWGRLFSDDLLPFSHQTANKLMAVASNSLLSNPAHVRNLPPHWGTLYELTKAEPATLKNAFKDGVITPDMPRKAVKALLPTKGTTKSRTKSPKTANASSEQAAAHSPSSDLYFRVSAVLSDFDALTRDEQLEFVSLLEQTVDHLRATINLSGAA
jgi:hypothetical protein